MRQITRTLLEKLDGFQWFTKVGIRDVAGVTYVPSWNEAGKYCSEIMWASYRTGQHFSEIDWGSWEGFQRDRLPRLTALIDYQKYNDWTSVSVPELRKIIYAMVSEKVRIIEADGDLRQEIYKSICGDIFGIVIEVEFSDLIKRGFYTSHILTCYESGHFPCGWEGSYPDGKLIIY